MSAPVTRRRHLWGHIVTGRVVMTGLWADALLVMASSAYNGGEAFVALGEARGQGIALGVAVDVALAVALIGDRALHLEGRSSDWGRAIRIITAGMSLALNCGVPLSQARLGVAAFHAFLPVLLVLLSEYAQDVTLQFGEIAEEYKAQQAQESTPAPSPATAPAPAWQPRTTGYQTPPATTAQPAPEQPAARFSAVPNMSTTGSAAAAIRPEPVAARDVAGAVPSPSHPDRPVGRPETSTQTVPWGVPQDVPTPSGETSHPVVSDRSAAHPAGRHDERPASIPPRRLAQRPARPPRTTAKHPARPMTDDQLADLIRDMAERNGGELPTAYQIKATHPVGHARASRVLAQLNPVPAGNPAANGAATRSEEASR